MEYKVRLTRVEKEHDEYSPLRTAEVVGTCKVLPAVNTYFSMFSQSLDPRLDARLVETSLISKVFWNEDRTVVTFDTRNSTYRLERL